MTTTVTLANTLTLGQPTVDEQGVKWWHRTVTGWRDGPAMRTNFSDRPLGPGAYDAPVWPGRRVIVLSGSAVAPDHTARLRAMQALRSLGADGSLVSVRIADELGEMEAMARRSDKPTMTMVGATSFDWSLQWTAAEPRLLDTVTRTVSTQMAQSGAGGVAWNGPAAGNQLGNPGFETNTTGWTVNGGTVAASLTHVHSGTFAGQITPTGSAASVFLESARVPVTPGAIVIAAGWVWATNAVTNNYSMSARWYNAAGTLLSTSTTVVSLTAATWTQSTNYYQAPANAASVTLAPTLTGTPAAAQVFYVDDAQLRVITGTQWNGPGPAHTGVSWGQPNSTGVLTLDNTQGSAEADVLLTITGPAQRPSVSTSAGWIIYNGNLGPGDTLVINTGSGSVLLDGVNRRPYLSRADWFTIPAGQTLAVRFTADIQNTKAALTASWRVSYL